MSDVAHVMNFVLYTPIGANPSCKLLCSLTQRRNVVACLRRSDNLILPFELDTSCRDPNQRTESCPKANALQGSTNTDNAFLNSSMTLAQLSVSVFCLKVRPHFVEQARLVAFECAEIVIVALNNLLTRFFGCLWHQSQTPLHNKQTASLTQAIP